MLTKILKISLRLKTRVSVMVLIVSLQLSAQTTKMLYCQ